MLGLSMNSIIWWRALYSSVSHFIQPSFLPSSSTSVSYLLLHPLLLVIFQFLIVFLFVSNFLHSFLFLKFFYINWFSSFLVYSSFHFNCSFSFLMLCFPQRHTCPWCATNSVDPFFHLNMFTSHFHVYLCSFPS